MRSTRFGIALRDLQLRPRAVSAVHSEDMARGACAAR